MSASEHYREVCAVIASPSSSQVQDTGLSRRQHRFKSGWGRHLTKHGLAIWANLFFMVEMFPVMPQRVFLEVDAQSASLGADPAATSHLCTCLISRSVEVSV